MTCSCHTDINIACFGGGVRKKIRVAAKNVRGQPQMPEGSERGQVDHICFHLGAGVARKKRKWLPSNTMRRAIKFRGQLEARSFAKI